MYKKILESSLAISSCFFLYLYPISVRSEQVKKLDSISIGIYEKGYQFGGRYKLNKSSTLGISINYLNLPIGQYDVGLSNEIPFNLSNKGIELAYSRYFHKNINNSGNFIRLALEISKINAYSRIKLSDFKFDLNPLTLTCRTCNDYLFESSNQINIIPRVSVGRQYKLSQNLFLETSIGGQYLILPKFNGRYESANQLPYYVQEEVSDAESLINTKMKNLPSIYPTINLSFIYKI